jgi:hypothetical protein
VESGSIGFFKTGANVGISNANIEGHKEPTFKNNLRIFAMQMAGLFPANLF